MSKFKLEEIARIAILGNNKYRTRTMTRFRVYAR